MHRKWIAASAIGLLASLSADEACTEIGLTAKDGGVIAARTLEFGFDIKSDVMVIPAGTAFKGSLPDGGEGIQYTSKYGMVGANAMGLTAMVDGINDQGLYVGLLYFPGYASYPDVTAENAARAMAPHEYGNWLLADFATIDEVKANFDKVVLVPVMVPAIKAAPPVHFIVKDRTGKAVVIEPTNNTLEIHDNPLGVLTNSPTFDWHMTNLRNYVNLSAVDVPPIAIGDVKLAQFGQGSGMHGLPGDFTPPSRFVRAVAFTQAALPVDTAQEAVQQAFHVLNNFDIPLGVVRDDQEGTLHADYTVWTSVADLKNLTWNFRTYENQSIHRIDVREALAGAKDGIKTISMKSVQPIVDRSTDFQK